MLVLSLFFNVNLIIMGKEESGYGLVDCRTVKGEVLCISKHLPMTM